MPTTLAEKIKAAHDEPNLNPCDQMIAVVLRHTECVVGQLGSKAACRGCGTTIYWITNKNGKMVPCDPDGLNHFATCPQAHQFRHGSAKGGDAGA